MKVGGNIIVLSARKNEFESALIKQKYQVYNKFDTLVNGKKLRYM